MQSHRLPLPVRTHDQSGVGVTQLRLQIAAESNNPSPSPVVLKTRIKRAWRGSGFGCGGNNRARNLQAQKAVTSMNLFHIAEKRDLG
jgi:hypothetical protein